jgi:spermidine synthase
MQKKFKSLFFVAIFLFSISQGSANEVKILHHSSNQFGPIWVFDDQAARCLSFVPPAQVVQSCMLPSRPAWMLFDYTSMMVSSVFFHDNPQKILMIGLGGGSMAKVINIILPQATLDIVEINPALPDITKKFFAFNPPAGTKIYVEDGAQFVKGAASGTYDIIILDAFTKDYIPPSMLSKEFALDIKRLLKQDGIVAANTFEANALHDKETKLFTEVFGSIYSATSQGNRIIFAKKGTLPDIREIGQRSVFWRFRLASVGINELQMMEIFKKMKKE